MTGDNYNLARFLTNIYIFIFYEIKKEIFKNMSFPGYIN